MEINLNWLVDCIPNELKEEIFNNLNYCSQMVTYLYFLKYDKFINCIELEKRFYRSLNYDDLKLLISINNVNLLEEISNLSPSAFYLESFIKVNEDILLLASECGAINILEWYIKKYGNYITKEVQIKCCYNTLKNGNLECLRLLKMSNIEWGSNIFLACAKSNNLELFKEMMKINLDIDEPLTSNGIINTIDLNDKFFVNSLHIRKNLNDIFNAICKNCNTEFLEHIYTFYPQIKAINIVKCINKKNSLTDQIKVIEWSLNKLYPMTVDYCNKAASIGNLELLIWLRKKGFPWDKEVIQAACEGGNIELFEYVKKYHINYKNFPLLRHAIIGNNLELVKLLYNEGDYLTLDCVNQSIKSNNFEIFSYLISNMTEHVMHNLQFLNELFLTPNENYLLYMIHNGYFIDKGVNIFLPFLDKLLCGRLKTIKCLDELFGIGNYLKYTIYKDNYEIFLWYINKYSIILKGDINEIIKGGNTKLLEWIIENDADIFTIKDCIVNNKKKEYIKYVKGILTPNEEMLINSDESIEYKNIKSMISIVGVNYQSFYNLLK